MSKPQAPQDTEHRNKKDKKDKTIITTLNCDNCGSTEPEDFSRNYVEEHVEKLVDGAWQSTKSWEYEDGSHTYISCDACGSRDVKENNP